MSPLFLSLSLTIHLPTYLPMYLSTYLSIYPAIYLSMYAVQGQRGPKRGFPTLRCDAPGGGWRCDAATLRGAGGAATLRRCRWASDAATLLALRRCDAGVTLRRCWRGELNPH